MARRRKPRSRWKMVAGGIGAIALLLLAGPRACVRTPDAARIASMIPSSLDSLPAWLAAREAETGVTDTAMTKRVVFADGVVRTPYSVVYLHGFSASRQETAPLSEAVARALGANLFEARLHGHGLTGKALGKASARDWLADAIEAMEIGSRLGDSVIVIGTSTGGTLGAWLAANASQRRAMRALVLISPNFGPRDGNAAYLTWPWASVVLPLFMPDRQWSPRNDEQRLYWNVRYPIQALFPMQALVEHVRDRSLDGYAIPTLTFFNTDDQVIDVARMFTWLDALDSASTAPVQRVQVLPTQGEDGHVLAGRIVAPSQTTSFRDRIVAFIRE